MKTKLLTLTFILIFTIPIFSQFREYPRPNQGNLSGGLGMNWIDGELFYSFYFTPEVSYGNFGVGLGLQLDFNQDGKLRSQNFDETSDYISLIRYVRYGLKNDPLYVKLGALDYYTLGYGNIIYDYNNTPSFDSRKNGLVFDVDFGKFGLESIYSQFGEAGLVGLRGYVRPLQYTTAGEIPIIGMAEIGATYSTDFNQYSGVVSGSFDKTTKKFNPTDDTGNMSIIGFDIGFPLLATTQVDLKLYTAYSKIIDFGSGVATGLMLNLNGLGIFSASARLERRFNNDQYLPAYFNSLYEVERFRVDTSSSSFSSKAKRLSEAINQSDGYFGELRVSILNTFDILGSYQRLDKKSDSGILHLETDISPQDLSFIARAGYDKINIRDEKDLFKLDDRSYLYAELGYKPIPYIIVSMVYSWTFSAVKDNDKNVIDYVPQKRIEPRVYFVVPFNFGGSGEGN